MMGWTADQLVEMSLEDIIKVQVWVESVCVGSRGMCICVCGGVGGCVECVGVHTCVYVYL